MECERILETAARLLTDCRESQGFSQRHLAEAAGVDSSLISKLETGRYNARLLTWARVFAAAGCPLRLDAPIRDEEVEGWARDESYEREIRQRDGRESRWR